MMSGRDESIIGGSLATEEEVQREASAAMAAGARRFLILTNINKRSNIIMILKTSFLYNVSVVVVGMVKAIESVLKSIPGNVKLYWRGQEEQVRADGGFWIYVPNNDDPACRCGDDAAKGKKNDLKLENVSDLLRRLNSSSEVKILGIEIPSSETQKKVTSLNSLPPLQTATALMLGNEGSGMSPKQLSVCDDFVYIKQYSGDTASFNVAVAYGIVVHRLWAAATAAASS